MSPPIETPVLIIGAGPVGLSLALDLAWRGVDSVVLEKTDGCVRYSKMGMVAVRSMEFCRRWGIAERVRRCGFPDELPLNQVFCTSLNGYELKTLEYPSMADEAPPPESPERRQRCPQLWFDPLLADAVRDYNDRVRLCTHTELVSLTEHRSGVRAMARDSRSGDPIAIEAQYAIACDGAGSDTRRALGIAFEGEVLSYSTGIYFRAPGLTQRHRMGPAERYMLVGPEGMWGNLTVVDGHTYWRLTVTGPRQRVEAEEFDARAALQRCLGDDSIGFEIDAVMPWRRSRLVAARYSSGRIHLAGDAAHVTAPNGGYGMNTGLADAVDLGWKIEAALAGWGGSGLLESYEPERRPAGIRAVNAAAVNFANVTPDLDYRDVMAQGAAGDACRRQLGDAFERSTRGEWETLGIALGYRYEGSPIIATEGSAPPPDDPVRYVQSARPGHRAPHAWLSPGRSTLDLFGRGFVLLRLGPAAPDPSPLVDAAQACGMPLTVLGIEQPEIARLYGRSLVLVRPDGHSAWRADAAPADPRRLIDTVRGAA